MSRASLEDRTQRAQAALVDLVGRSSAVTALLITKEGNCITEAGDTSYLNTTAMAALVAGMFSATREVARMVGEKQFFILLQQGESRHIHISLVNSRVMMVVVFEDYQLIGRVRHESRKAAEGIAEALEEAMGEEDRPRSLVGPAFKELALNLVDRIFAAK